MTGLHAHPVLAGLLGFIPGVGAMYNGQYIKALAHVLIFAVFVSLSDKSFVFGMLLAAWIFYQVFDAAQTAKARRDGLPLPNPFGLNDLGSQAGHGSYARAAPYVAGFSPGAAPGGPAATPTPIPIRDRFHIPPQAPVRVSCSRLPIPRPTACPRLLLRRVPGPSGPGAYIPPVYGAPGPIEPAEHKHPVGAVVLIIIGIVLLLQTLGVFEEEWIGRAWPVVDYRCRRLAALPQNAGYSARRFAMNAWLLIRRLRGPAFLILVGITALLNQWGVLSFSRSWPLYLILAGVLGLAERAAIAAAPPAVPPPLYPGAYAGSRSGSGLPAADPLADPNRRA